MEEKAENENSKWPMRLAVISTIATVAALFTPFLMPYFTSEDKESNTVLPDTKTVKQIKEDGKEVIKDLKPKLPKDLPKKPPFPPGFPK